MDLSMVQARTRTDGFTTAIAPQHPSILVVAALQAWWVSLCIWPLDNVNPAHAMQVRERFATNGYVIFYGAVHEDTINSWRTIARQTEGWFDDEVNDMIMMRENHHGHSVTSRATHNVKVSGLLSHEPHTTYNCRACYLSSHTQRKRVGPVISRVTHNVTNNSTHLLIGQIFFLSKSI
jgi:hypothetical protein